MLRGRIHGWVCYWAGWLVGTLSTVALAAVVTAHAAETVQVLSFGDNRGNLRMYKYVPDGLPAGAPLVVALHGCTQSAVNFDDESGWTQLADLLKFALLLPEQQNVNNSRLCFRWFMTDHNRRGQGEAASIASMVDKMKAEHGIDPNRIFVTGLSGGGAMTAVMLAAYPDVYRAGAIIAGIPYACASTSGDPIATAAKIGVVASFGEDGWAALRCGISLDGTPQIPTVTHMPGVWRSLLSEAGALPTTWPKVSIWHGSDDPTVNPRNLDELMEQWTAAHGIDQRAEREDVTATYKHKEYKDTSGDTKVETYEFARLGHAVPVNPGTGPGTCGQAKKHFSPVGVCSASLIARFWGLRQ